ncbi:aldose epimerase family protein [Sphingomonas hankookensis]
MMPAIETFLLHHDDGIRVIVTNLGATLMAVNVPDHSGRRANVLLSHARPADYPAAGAPGPDAYMGATCGRYANRVTGAAFPLDGMIVRLVANEGANQLHGGVPGFHRAVWRVERAEATCVILSHRSPDGEAGWPGALSVTTTFLLPAPDTLRVVYHATTDRPTHVNLVSHPYFNLSGDPATTIHDHRLRIASDRFLPIDAAALPTGERRSVAGTPFDFRASRPVGREVLPGYNHNYCLSGDGMREVAWLDHAGSGRSLTIATDRPGLQFYDGYGLSGAFAPHTGLCLEAQGWPDAANHPDFPSSRIDPGDRWQAITEWRFGPSPAS